MKSECSSMNSSLRQGCTIVLSISRYVVRKSGSSCGQQRKQACDSVKLASSGCLCVGMNTSHDSIRQWAIASPWYNLVASTSVWLRSHRKRIEQGRGSHVATACGAVLLREGV